MDQTTRKWAKNFPQLQLSLAIRWFCSIANGARPPPTTSHILIQGKIMALDWLAHSMRGDSLAPPFLCFQVLFAIYSGVWSISPMSFLSCSHAASSAQLHLRSDPQNGTETLKPKPNSVASSISHRFFQDAGLSARIPKAGPAFPMPPYSHQMRRCVLCCIC